MGRSSSSKELPYDIAELKLYGIFKEATRLVQKHSYLFLALVSTFFIPYILINFLLLLALSPYSIDLWHFWTGEPSMLANLSAHVNLIPVPQFILFILLCRLLSVALSLFLVTALTFSVAQVYTTGEPSYAAVLEQLPQLWPRVGITFLWSSSILLLFEVASTFLIVFIYNLLKDLGINSAWYFAACLFSIVISCVLYVSILWLLSIVIPVLEDSVGRDALVRSSYLILGKKCVALSFLIIFEVLGVVGVAVLQAWIISYQYEYLLVRIFVLALLVLAASIVALYFHVMLPVLYFSAKAYHEQSLSAAFIEGYSLIKADV
ncbi:hypothetical protein O6H91_12G055300 [Diphasiastrum complanatum]|uniref:Uncharacterized protein n=1 Tax=Diphasiastrum complanatum TaxID=34168 RepID=A0ACC2C2M7_DIPCM|nr:hypothetical protein O6H91_Y498400 [Diphasiastrum complanatum]KAJ7536064.1 hypothetical protein O6H91_12G055300 [Diphasiastrum complanatum]